MSIYYTRKNIRQQYKTNQLKIIPPTWNDEFKLSDCSYSVSHIPDYIEKIIKIHEILPTNPSIYIYINKIKNTQVFKRWIQAGITNTENREIIC